MDYLTVRQTADNWGVSVQWVQLLLKERHIKGTERPGHEWLIHKDTVRRWWWDLISGYLGPATAESQGMTPRVKTYESGREHRRLR